MSAYAQGYGEILVLEFKFVVKDLTVACPIDREGGRRSTKT